jgi:Rps23 Pro-64 3,4-dihydroxylase Tpa1-like proline 4-hydroxylase
LTAEQEKNSIEINPALDRDALALAFQQTGRVQARHFLTQDSADRIADSLTGQKRWNLVYRAAGKHVDSDVAAVQKWPQSQRRKLDRIIYDEASLGFQYRYATIPLYDIYHGQQMPGHFFNAIFRFLNSNPFIEIATEISGDEQIRFADAQATRYEVGDFLTSHDDEVAGKNRRVAYVLGLTRDWRPDWGGALSFVDQHQRIEESCVPSFNTLTLFRVPMLHLVGVIAPFARASRYSITGWLRSGDDPMRL